MTNSRTIALFIWITASVFYAYQYILRVMPNIMLGEIMQHFNIDAAVFGQFSGVYYIGYSLLHLPIGMMLDRFGPKRVMSICIILTAIGMLPLAFSDNFIYPIIGRALIGIASSAAILGTFKIIRMTFKEQHFTRMLSFTVTIGLIGAIYGGTPLSNLYGEVGYQAMIQIFAAFGIVLAVITYLLVPEISEENNRTVIADLKIVFSNKKVIALCLFAGLMVGPLEGFADVWASVFLKQIYGFDNKLATSIPSMIFVGMCFGSPVLSFIGEKTGSYSAVIVGAGLIMLMVFNLLITELLSINLMTAGFILVGVCCAYQILAIYKASTYVPNNVAGLTTAVANMIIMSFGYGFHSLIGLIVQKFGGPSSKEALLVAMNVIPITLALGTLGFVILGYHDRVLEKRKEV